MSLSEYVDYMQYKQEKKALCSLTTCLIRAGGFLFGNYGKIAPMVERWIEAPRVTGSNPVLSTYRKVVQPVRIPV